MNVSNSEQFDMLVIELFVVFIDFYKITNSKYHTNIKRHALYFIRFSYKKEIRKRDVKY